MRVLESIGALREAGPSAVTIGNFDGVHAGHQAIMRRLTEAARNSGLQSVALTFDPHPIRYLAPPKAPLLIATRSQKIRWIEAAGVDVLAILPFNESLSRRTADEFVQEFLLERLQARLVCVGHNFTFGQRALGTVETLRRYPELDVTEVAEVEHRGQIVSSTRIRSLVTEGRVSTAARLLGRFLQIEGDIVRGDGRGRRVTVPTLNLRAHNELLPRIGVYVTRIEVDGSPGRPSITNVGLNPTFGVQGLHVETYILDGVPPGEPRLATIEFIRRVRNEQRFETAEALRHQILIDVTKAKRFHTLWSKLRKNRGVAR